MAKLNFLSRRIGGKMAKCPQCNKLVWHVGILFNTGWRTIPCNNCGSRLYIRGRDFFIWYLPSVLIFFVVGLRIIKNTNIKASILGLALTALSAAVYFILGWFFTKLEIAK